MTDNDIMVSRATLTSVLDSLEEHLSLRPDDGYVLEAYQALCEFLEVEPEYLRNEEEVKTN